MKIVATGRTDVGKNRTENEDTLVVDPAIGLYGVCDGMGGHAAGEVAAALALDSICRTVRFRPWVKEKIEAGEADIETGMGLLDRAVRAANLDVLTLAREHSGYRGMGCTSTALFVAAGRGALASVGDSRFYLSRNGTVEQLTMDHTIGEEFKRAGTPPPPMLAGPRYARLLSRSIGIGESVTPDVFSIEFQVGDRFVICTDGLSDYLKNEQSLQSTLHEGSLKKIADRLIDFANDSGGHDNITVVVGEVLAD